MPKRAGLVIAAALALISSTPTPAFAARHFWDIEEIFSNEDGSIQFIELFTTSGSQQFLSDFSISVRDESQKIAEYTFPTNLAPGTANKSFLVGTQSLADLPEGVTPDYIIPEGFIDVDLAVQVKFASFDSFNLNGLPLDGVNSLNFGTGSQPATPTNYAGEIGFVPEPSAALANAGALLCLAALARRRVRVRPVRSPEV